MPHPIHRFVITGGPCSGKTTGLATIQQRLTNMGYQVLVCPETATMTLQAGISPMEIGNIVFQGVIIEVQMQHEQTFVNVAKLMAENGPVVILHDRGLMDGKAYVDNHVWEAIVEQKYNESRLRDQYDAVVHLVTAAVRLFLLVKPSAGPSIPTCGTIRLLAPGCSSTGTSRTLSATRTWNTKT